MQSLVIIKFGVLIACYIFVVGYIMLVIFLLDVVSEVIGVLPRNNMSPFYPNVLDDVNLINN